jgi:hypothetical protein
MPIVCKWATNGEQLEVQFKNVEEMMAHRMYDDFSFINMAHSNSTYMPLILPRNLQILRFNDNKIFNLPPLPATLHSIFGKNNRLFKFPEVSHCLELEDIDFNGNDIEELDCYIPESVKTIDVCFSRLKSINYEKIPTHVKISASYCYLTRYPPNSHIRNIEYDHNDISKIFKRVVPTIEQVGQPIAVGIGDENTNWFRPVYQRVNILAPTQPISSKTIVGTERQSVHNSSIQASVNKSLEYVLNYIPNNQIPEDLITEVICEYKRKVINRSPFRKFLRGISRKWAESGINVPPIRQWCLVNDIHSQFGVTYKTLLKQVWAIIQDHKHKEEMKEVLFQELNDSKYVCFTGRFTRTLNALTGFIEQVQIGINSREQMSNQITMAIKKSKEKFGADFQSDARANVKKILVEFEIPEIEHEAWLDAID